MIVDSVKKQEFIKHQFIKVQNKLLNKNSNAESRFANLLARANIYFRREKCNFKLGTRWCYYDFFLPVHRLYIEIDGESHNSLEQQKIDKEKEMMIKNKGYFMVRYTNEEVLKMEYFSLEEAITRMCIQMRKKGCGPEARRKRYFNNLEYKFQQSVEDIKKSAICAIDESKEVYLYDNAIGNYFCFDNIIEAKLNTQLTINEIINLLNYDYIKHSSRRFVFGWTLEECEQNVAKVYY